MGYNTKQGEQVLDVLARSGGAHMTADEICHASGVGRTTVYRQLEKLQALGEVRRFVVDEGKSACYQYVVDSGECRNHYHLKCSECGALLHVDCGELDRVTEHLEREHGFMINEGTTVLYGLCGECRKKKGLDSDED